MLTNPDSVSPLRSLGSSPLLKVEFVTASFFSIKLITLLPSYKKQPASFTQAIPNSVRVTL